MFRCCNIWSIGHRCTGFICLMYTETYNIVFDNRLLYLKRSSVNINDCENHCCWWLCVCVNVIMRHSYYFAQINVPLVQCSLRYCYTNSTKFCLPTANLLIIRKNKIIRIRMEKRNSKRPIKKFALLLSDHVLNILVGKNPSLCTCALV